MDRFALLTSLWLYSMYLAHQPVLDMMHNLHKTSLMQSLPILSWKAWGLLSIIVVYAVSGAVHHGFELPILRWRDQSRAHPEAKKSHPSRQALVRGRE